MSSEVCHSYLQDLVVMDFFQGFWCNFSLTQMDNCKDIAATFGEEAILSDSMITPLWFKLLAAVEQMWGYSRFFPLAASLIRHSSTLPKRGSASLGHTTSVCVPHGPPTLVCGKKKPRAWGFPLSSRDFIGDFGSSLFITAYCFHLPPWYRH